MKTIDNRGLNCPEPLLRTRQALQETGELISLVDNIAARENILRYARSQGLTTAWENVDDYYVITITGSAAGPTAPKKNTGVLETDEPGHLPEGRPANTVVMITGELFGEGDEQLGELLMRSFIFTLTKQESSPDSILLVNSAVRLAVTGSPVLEELQELVARGVKILSCGTCLDYYNLTPELAVGEITNMYDLAESLTAAGKIITI